MGDAENSLPPSKKRAAGREISRDNPGLDDEEDSSEQETGTFKRASDEVLANRRIVKVRRNQTTSTASSNPFSGICLVPPTEPTVTPGAIPESSATTSEVTAEAPISSEKEVSEDGKNDVNKSEKNDDANNQQPEKKIDETEPESVKSESENIKQSESKKDEPVSDAVADKESAEDKVSDVVNEETQKDATDEKPAGGVKTEDEDKKDDKTANADNKDKSSENADSTAEGASLSSKKRASGREISRDNPGLDDEEDSSEQGTGTFKRATDQVLANRRILKVRRNQTTSTASNPFSGIRLVPPAEPTITPAAPSAVPESRTTTTEVTAEAPIPSEKEVSEDGKNDVNKAEKNEDGNNQQSEKKTDEMDHESSKSENENIKQSESKKDEPVSDAVADKESAEDKGSDVVKEETQKEANDEKLGGVETEDEDKKDDKTANADNKDMSCENADSTAEGASLSSFQQLSSSQNAFTGLAGTGFSTSSFSFGSTPKDGSTSSVPLFGQKSDQPSFGFGLSTNGNSSLFNTSGTSIVSKSEGNGFPAMQEVPVETGEENEKVVFSADSVLFEFIDAVWKERGKGELKVNVSTTGTERARVLMRARGNYRLILNASLYPDMKLTNMEKRGITFACMNITGEEKEGLSTFALKFKDASIVEQFRAAVMAHKGNTAAVLKTPENSPKASEA